MTESFCFTKRIWTRLCTYCLFPIHCRRPCLDSQIDQDKSGEISIWELFEALDLKQTRFTKRIFRYKIRQTQRFTSLLRDNMATRTDLSTATLDVDGG